jgi:hypothetical protein
VTLAALRRQAGGWYLTDEELSAALAEAYESALDSASLEVYEGKYTGEEMCTMVDRAEIILRAFEQIKPA